MPVTPDSPAPYAPASAILDIIGRYRTKGLPIPVTAEVLGRAGVSGSLIPRTLQALKALDLVGEDGKPTQTLEALRLSQEAEFKNRLAEWLSAAYADVLQFVNPATADDTVLRDAFRSYNPIAQQPRMITLFKVLHAAAGIGPEKAKASSATVRSKASPSVKSKPMEPKRTSAEDTTIKHDPKVQQNNGTMSNTALEYKLVDLLKEDDIGDDQRAAVWILIQYLTAKKRS